MLKSPVRANCTPGSVRGRSGDWPSYRDGGRMSSRAFYLGSMTPQENEVSDGEATHETTKNVDLLASEVVQAQSPR
jgi:hypothetical protein